MRMKLAIACLAVLAPAVHAEHSAHAAPPQTSPAPRPVQPAAPAGQPAPRPGQAARPAPLPPPLPSIDLAAVPEPCKALAKQAVAPSVSTALSARISLAGCMADRAIAPLTLCDCAASIAEVDAAVAPALRVLDDAIAVADPVNQILAEHAEAKLFAGFAARLVATLPQPSPGAAESELALRDLRKQTLDAQLAPWREAALASYQHVVDVAKAHPEIAGQPAVAAALRDSQQHLAAEAADRPVG